MGIDINEVSPNIYIRLVGNFVFVYSYDSVYIYRT